MTLDPVDAVVSIFEGLKPKDKQRVAVAIGIEQKEAQRTKCERDGHKYVKVRETEPAWWGLVPGTLTFVCSQCGESIVHRAEV